MPKTIKYPFTKRFLKIYLQGKASYYLWGLIALIITILIITTIPNLIQNSIDALNSYDSTATSRNQLQIFALIIFISGFALCLVRSLSRILIFIPGRQIENQIRKDFFSAAVSIPIEEIAKHNIGDLISRGTNDISSIRIMISMGILHTFNSTLMITLCLYFMIQTSWKLTLICFIPIPLLIIATNYIAKIMLRYARKSQYQLGNLSESIRELLKAYDLFAIFDILPFIRQDFDKDNDSYLKYSKLLAKSRVYLFSITVAIINLSIFLLIYYGSKLILDEQLTIGQFVAFSLYMNILINPLRAIGWLISTLQRGEICLARIFPIIDQAEEYLTRETNKKISSEEEFALHRSSHDQLIKVNQLSFSYPNDTKQKFSIQIENLIIENKKKYGIFGKTGSGKSTLLKLLAAKIKPQSGTLLLNDINYQDIREETIQEQFSIVFQENHHFIGSVEENLENIVKSGNKQPYKYSTPIEDAYSISQFSNDVKQLPDQHTTMLGEFGFNLSGGQKQRLSLARALVYPAQILFLDDFISAVDHKTEKDIIDNIFLQLQQTVIMTSHRISALKQCDEIWIVDNGKIVIKATHDYLMQNNQEYATTYHYQQFENRQDN